MTSNEVKNLESKIEDITNSIDELFDDIEGTIDDDLDPYDLEEIEKIKRHTDRAIDELNDVESEIDTIPDSEEKLIEEDDDEDDEEEDEVEEDKNNENKTE